MQAVSMTTDLSPQTTRQAVEAADRSAPGRVTGRLKTAIDKMVWEGARRAEAAKSSSMTDHSLRSALNKPHVKAYYRQQLDVLRTSERARNIHALVDVRDQTENKMARVQAVKALEQISDDEQVNRGQQAAPGMVIVINNGPPLIQHQARIEPKPLIEHKVVHDEP